MIDSANADTARADAARAQLLRDIRELKKMGNNMIDKTETALHKTPILVGLGAVGFALLGVAIVAGRRPRPALPFFTPKRSFLAEATRGVALSALGILSGRITQHLLTSALDEKPRSAR